MMKTTRKLSALLLAVVMMLLVMTGCSDDGAADAKTLCVKNVNRARIANQVTTVTYDSDLDASAKIITDWYLEYLNGTNTYQGAMNNINQVLNVPIVEGQTTVEYTDTGLYMMDREAYYSGNYTFKTGDGISTTRGNFVGVYATPYQGKMLVCVLLVHVYRI